MRIAISTGKGGLDDMVFPVFGRCQTFTIVDADKGITGSTVIPNPAASAGGGAGIMAAQAALDQGINAVITGNCGPNSYRVFSQAGIGVYLASGKAEDAVKALLEGKLQPLNAPAGPAKFGMGGGMGGGFGRGGGMGRGGGGGFGRGQGRGGY